MVTEGIAPADADECCKASNDGQVSINDNLLQACTTQERILNGIPAWNNDGEGVCINPVELTTAYFLPSLTQTEPLFE